MLQDKAMLIRPSWGRPTATKKDVRMSETAAKIFSVKHGRSKTTKTLYAGTVYDKIVAADNKTSMFIKTYTRPWLDDGWRILPSMTFFEVQEEIGRHRDEREVLVDKFIEQLPQIKELDALALGDAYNPADYDSNVREKFRFDVVFMPIPRAGDFRAEDIDPQDVARIEAETMQRISDQFKSTDLWKRVHDEVRHMSERLHAYDIDENGRVVNKFHDTLVTNLRNLVSILPKLNIVGDPELDAMHKRLSQELCYWEPQMLRDDETVRKDVATKADQILADVSMYMA